MENPTAMKYQPTLAAETPIGRLPRSVLVYGSDTEALTNAITTSIRWYGTAVVLPVPNHPSDLVLVSSQRYEPDEVTECYEDALARAAAKARVGKAMPLTDELRYRSAPLFAGRAGAEASAVARFSVARA